MPKPPSLDSLKTFLLQFSLDDIAKAFLALNLWLPNIASPIKSQFLFCVLERICSQLPFENQLLTYEAYDEFCKQLFPLLPSFEMFEDYVPESDWGNIKYFYDDQFYKIFYGGDLSNPYDFYYAFEVIHKRLDRYYLQLLGRSRSSMRSTTRERRGRMKNTRTSSRSIRQTAISLKKWFSSNRLPRRC